MTREPRRLSRATARRVAIRAQGLDGARDAPVTQGDIVRLVRRQGVLQIDSVNVLARAHLLPIFSRLGRFAPADLARAAEGRRRKLFEYWGHEASFLPIETWPLFAWRREDAMAGRGLYAKLARHAREAPDAIAAVLARLEGQGPMAASDFAHDRPKGTASWWGWSGPKQALEWLFWTGQVTTHSRRGNFERVYDLPRRCLPPGTPDRPAPPRAEAQRALIAAAAARLGVAAAVDLRDYFRLPATDFAARLAECVEMGVLVPVRVEGWDAPAYAPPDLTVPRKLARQPAVLLAPFDPLVWHRDRAERLFGFTYRIEIYVPAEKRVHGYYVLPFLQGERLTARCCLKADRTTRRLLVRTAHGEAGIDRSQTAQALAGELGRMADWLGLDEIAVSQVGDLAAPLREALGRRA